MVTENTLIKFGLTKDENNLKLKEVLKNNIEIKEIHIDMYSENPLTTSTAPYMLLLRTIEKNATVLNDGDRVILKKNDRYGTYFMNILFSNIIECYYKFFNNNFEFILNIQNTYCRLIVLN